MQKLAICEGRDKQRFILHGSVGGGKSLVQAILALHVLGSEEFNRSEKSCLIVGVDTGAIDRNVMDKFRFLLGNKPGLVKFFRSQNSAYILGQKFEVRSIDKPSVADRIAGARWDLLIADELTRAAEEPLRECLSRTRGKLIGTTNPDSPSHFIKTEFIDNPDKDEDLGSFFIPTVANPTFSEKYIEHMRKSYRKNSTMFARMAEGEWVNAEGKIYEVVPKKNTYGKLPDIFIKDGPKYQAIIGLDWGVGSQTAIVLCFVERKNTDFPNVFVEENIVIDRGDEKGGSSHGIKRAIGSLIGDKNVYPRMSGIYVDRSALSVINEIKRDPYLSEFGVRESRSEVLPGIDFVSKMLLFGSLKIKRGLHILKEFDGYLWDEISCSKGKDAPIKKDDHSLDALRYAIYTHICINGRHRSSKSTQKKEALSPHSNWQNFME